MIDFVLWLLEVKDFVFLVEQTILYNQGPRCLASWASQMASPDL